MTELQFTLLRLSTPYIQASFPLSMKYNTADTPPNEITEINTDSL